MLYLFAIVCGAAIFLWVRFIALKKQIRNLNKQLHRYNHQQTGKKIDIALIDRDIEQTAAEVNDLIDLHVQEKSERARFENELKQTIANMSHDLRTPLTSILGYLQLAESGDATDQERMEHVATAKRRAQRLEALLQDFFQLSVIESADFELKLEQVNIKNITVDVLMGFYDRFQEKGMEPVIVVPEQSVFLTSDESAVTRIVENLINNAITHSDGNIVIRLEDHDSTIRFSVTNDAVTLTQHDVDRFFDRFFMADQARSGKNTGLGLSIVKSLMLKMGGTVTASLTGGQLTITCEWRR